jgi:hypothetical protein
MIVIIKTTIAAEEKTKKGTIPNMTPFIVTSLTTLTNWTCGNKKNSGVFNALINCPISSKLDAVNFSGCSILKYAITNTIKIPSIPMEKFLTLSAGKNFTSISVIITPNDDNIIQNGTWVKIIKTYCEKSNFKIFTYAKKIGSAIAIIIHPAETKILFNLKRKIVSSFIGVEKRKSVSLLKYRTDMAAAIDDNTIISENVM